MMSTYFFAGFVDQKFAFLFGIQHVDLGVRSWKYFNHAEGNNHHEICTFLINFFQQNYEQTFFYYWCASLRHFCQKNEGYLMGDALDSDALPSDQHAYWTVRFTF